MTFAPLVKPFAPFVFDSFNTNGAKAARRSQDHSLYAVREENDIEVADDLVTQLRWVIRWND